MARIVIIFAMISMVGASFSYAQTSVDQAAGNDKKGTCATVMLGPAGIAFTIDSRVTEMAGEKIVRQYPGCKALLARPTIIIAGIGLSDTTGMAGHWNSLDAASAALISLPAQPSAEQLNDWGNKWADSLIAHFRMGRETPSSPRPVSETILVTQIGSVPYFLRTTVLWNGLLFEKHFQFLPFVNLRPQAFYAGACREFVGHEGFNGERLPPSIQRTDAEIEDLNHWGALKNNAKSISELMAAASGTERVLTEIDPRLESEIAVIAPPYASAQWPVGATGWQTEFNEECKPVVPALKK